MKTDAFFSDLEKICRVKSNNLEVFLNLGGFPEA